MATTATTTTTTTLSSSGDQKQAASIKSRLFTQNTQYAIPDSWYFVPSNWRRFHLSQLINKVLKNPSDASVPFDFLIEGELLRTSIDEFIKSKGLNEETNLEIEYIPSILPPSETGKISDKKWISDISLRIPGRFLSTSYHECATVTSTSAGIPEINLPHTHPVLSASWLKLKSNDNDDKHVATGSMGGLVKVWDTSSQNVLYDLDFHEDSINSVRSSARSPRLLTSAKDGKIAFYNFEHIQSLIVEDDDIQNQTSGDRKKRRRKDDLATTQKLRPTSVLRGHNGPVSRAIFDHQNDSKAYSAGWDHTVRSWSLDIEQVVTEKTSDKVILDMDQTQTSDVVITGSTDKLVCLWDLRQDTQIISTTLQGHTGPVSSVKAHPTSPLLFVSGSYDSTIKVWDARSPKQSLFTVNRNKSGDRHKILCLDWDGEKIVSGGEDDTIMIHKASL